MKSFLKSINAKYKSLFSTLKYLSFLIISPSNICKTISLCFTFGPKNNFPCLLLSFYTLFLIYVSLFTLFLKSMFFTNTVINIIIPIPSLSNPAEPFVYPQVLLVNSNNTNFLNLSITFNKRICLLTLFKLFDTGAEITPDAAFM